MVFHRSPAAGVRSDSHARRGICAYRL